RTMLKYQFTQSIEAYYRNARQTEVTGREKIGGQFGSSDVSPGRPDRQDGGQFRQTSPLADHVIDVEQLGVGNPERGRLTYRLALCAGPTVLFDSYGNSQGRITNQERGVCLLQHRPQVRRRFKEFRRDLPLFRTEDARERLRAARTAIQREALRPFDGLLCKDQQA